MPIKPTPTIPILTIVKSLSAIILRHAACQEGDPLWPVLEAKKPFYVAFFMHFSGSRP
jgi:hypothetical protein